MLTFPGQIFSTVNDWFINLTGIQKLILFLISVIFFAGIIKAGYYTTHYGGTDLRVRVVGARLLDSQHSPYFYKWSNGDPETLLNPNDREALTNGVSVAPGVLLLTSFFNALHYKPIRILWSILQYLMISYILLSIVFSKNGQDNSKKLWTLGIGTIFFACSGLWFMNIERGQVYILYAFFFCVIWQLYDSRLPRLQFIAGVVLAFAVYCRPPFAVLLIPILFNRNRSILFGLFLGGLLCAIHGIIYLQVWKDYFSAMSVYAGLNQHVQSTIPSPVNYPKIVEGCSNLTLFRENYLAGGIYPVYHYFQSVNNIPRELYLIVYATLVAIFIVAYRRKLLIFTIDKTILFGFLLYILSEIFIPANRAGYNVIQWVFPTLLMLRKSRFDQHEFILLLCGLFFIISFPFYFPRFHDIGELLMIYCLIRYLNEQKVPAPSPDSQKPLCRIYS